MVVAKETAESPIPLCLGVDSSDSHDFNVTLVSHIFHYLHDLCVFKRPRVPTVLSTDSLCNQSSSQMKLRPCFLDPDTTEKNNGWYEKGVNAREVPADNILHVGRCSSDGNLARE